MKICCPSCGESEVIFDMGTWCSECGERIEPDTMIDSLATENDKLNKRVDELEKLVHSLRGQIQPSSNGGR